MRNEIFIGSLDNPSYYFDNNTIMSASVVQNVALVGQELSVDTFTAQVMDNTANLTDVVLFRSSDGHTITVGDGQLYAASVGSVLGTSDLIYVPYKTPVWFLQDGDLVGKFYLDDVQREGKNLYRIEAVSAIGVLDKMEHVGGLFLRSTFGQVVKHILHGKPEV